MHGATSTPGVCFFLSCWFESVPGSSWRFSFFTGTRVSCAPNEGRTQRLCGSWWTLLRPPGQFPSQTASDSGHYGPASPWPDQGGGVRTWSYTWNILYSDIYIAVNAQFELFLIINVGPCNPVLELCNFTTLHSFLSRLFQNQKCEKSTLSCSCLLRCPENVCDIAKNTDATLMAKNHVRAIGCKPTLESRIKHRYRSKDTECI